MTHRYSDMLGWLQAGQQILGKWRGGVEGHFPVSFNSREVAYAVDGAEGWEFRLKPRTVKIGSLEVEAPVLEPVEGQTLWFTNSSGVAQSSMFEGESGLKAKRVSGGRCFASEAAAIAAHEAITALLRGEA